MRLFGSLAGLIIERNALYSQVKNSLVTRDLFISTASHELRTPLTVIYGYAQWLEDYLKKDKMPELRWAEVLIKESQRMNFLINELLRVEQLKIGETQFHFKKITVKSFINSTIKKLKPEFKKHRVIVDVNIPKKSFIYGDFKKLQLAISNVLKNAVQFSPYDTTIRLKVTNTTKYFYIEIEDEGGGISKEEIPKIFKGFYKRPGPNIGMGIGLFLAKRITQQHDGDIYIKSTKNKGTTVIIKLPRVVYKSYKRKEKDKSKSLDHFQQIK